MVVSLEIYYKGINNFEESTHSEAVHLLSSTSLQQQLAGSLRSIFDLKCCIWSPFLLGIGRELIDSERRVAALTLMSADEGVCDGFVIWRCTG